MYQFIQASQVGSTFEIVLNRPDKRNAISLELWHELDAALKEANRASGVRCIVMRGEGKGFSAGIDLSTLTQLGDGYGADWLSKMRLITADIQAVVNRLERSELPTIALLHGFCLGMGMELALACDFRIGTSDLKMGLPEVHLGIIPDVGGTTRLVKLVGAARAKEIIMTGRQLDAAYLERVGILNQVVEPAQLTDAGKAMESELSKGAPLAIGMAKRVIDGMIDQDRGLSLEAWAQAALFQTADFREAAAAMSERRPPRFSGK
ncbi:MAG: enoyl-CoA hydratase/isomerase family protein [Deltaproteobacteria bacterium]|nr:enoyl-CoA hydratase/isomerase family protein [Deltaproteobacteria bacterium]